MYLVCVCIDLHQRKGSLCCHTHAEHAPSTPKCNVCMHRLDYSTDNEITVLKKSGGTASNSGGSMCL